MNLTYKAEWINKTYMYLNVNIGSEKKGGQTVIRSLKTWKDNMHISRHYWQCWITMPTKPCISPAASLYRERFDLPRHHGCTPLWKSNRNIFSTQFFYHLFFVVCSSFYTWYMWGGQYQFCKFLLDFDHWLYLSDILKKVTGSKPDVALVWFMQWAKMELEHGEKDRYWCTVNSVGGSYESITDFRKPVVRHKSID